jgi:hypothetical protein
MNSHHGDAEIYEMNIELNDDHFADEEHLHAQGSDRSLHSITPETKQNIHAAHNTEQHTDHKTDQKQQKEQKDEKERHEQEQEQEQRQEDDKDNLYLGTLQCDPLCAEADNNSKICLLYLGENQEFQFIVLSKFYGTLGWIYNSFDQADLPTIQAFLPVFQAEFGTHETLIEFKQEGKDLMYSILFQHENHKKRLVRLDPTTALGFRAIYTENYAPMMKEAMNAHYHNNKNNTLLNSFENSPDREEEEEAETRTTEAKEAKEEKEAKEGKIKETKEEQQNNNAHSNSNKNQNITQNQDTETESNVSEQEEEKPKPESLHVSVD